MKAKQKRLKKQRADKRRKARQQRMRELAKQSEQPERRLPREAQMWDVSGQIDPSRWPDAEPPCAAYVDDKRQLAVLVFRTQLQGRFAGTLQVGIRLNVRPAQPGAAEQPQAVVLATWSEIQAIKDHFWPHRQAVEVYPPKGQKPDLAPLRWLWVLPAGESLPFEVWTRDGKPD